MKEPVILLQKVDFRYGASPVLEDVSLAVSRGEFTSIVGPNGGGKTTLLRILLGQLAPDRGRVLVFGRPPAESRRRIGYMPQRAEHDPLFPATALDVVLMGLVDRRPIGTYTRKDRAAGFAAMEQVGLADQGRRHFAELSGGQRQRVLIARALVAEPEMLLLDEPTANVDLAGESKLLELLRELNRRMTILMVSHDIAFVSAYVNSVICVNRKVVVHPTSALTGDRIRDIYGWDLRVVRHEHRVDGAPES